MRAKEFVNEGTEAKLSKRKRFATRGLNLVTDGEHWNSDYVFNRVMMAAACTDGTFIPEMDDLAWAGKWKTAQPYTKEEQEMLKMAYKAAGAKWRDLNKGDMRSQEYPQGLNTKSPVVSFKGYPR